ncbi:hypothetical protein KNE206_13620 [Kitasatospora sp. NE20-6]
MARPPKGSTTSAASAKTVNTIPAASGPSPRTWSTYTNMYGIVKPLPNALSALPAWTRRSGPPALSVRRVRCFTVPVTVHTPLPPRKVEALLL